MAASSLADFEAFNATLQKALLSSARLASQLPAAGELQYQRTLSRPLARKVDEASQRLLHISSRVLDIAKQHAASTTSKGKKAAAQADLQEDDVLEGYQKKIVEVTDQLLEGIDEVLDEQHARSKTAGTSSSEIPIASTSTSMSQQVNYRNAGDIRKPQLDFYDAPDNTREAIFKPVLPSKPNALVPLDLTPVTEEITDGSPAHTYIRNPYTQEIWAATNQPLPEVEPSAIAELSERASNRMHIKPYTFVDTSDLLAECLAKLKTAQVVAVDLEHHDQHSYRGFTCLIQISTTEEDFIVDPLVPSVRSALHSLNEVFTDPSVVKVLHGAEYDILWLQQDFGLYIVNLFDTYHASRALFRQTGHGLASLLNEYTAFTPDKKYQLADWRIRPLTPELIHYARSDTHFLIYIYNALRSDASMNPDLLADIRQRSARTAAQSYNYAAYDVETGKGQNGWYKMADRAGKLQLWGVEAAPSAAGTGSAESAAPWTVWRDKLGRAKYAAMRALHDWRDQVARKEDVSTHHVLPSRSLLTIAEQLPKDLGQLIFALGPDMKDFIKARSDDILEQVAKGIAEAAAESAEAAEAVSSQDKSAVDSGTGPASSSQALFGGTGDSSASTSRTLTSKSSVLFGQSANAVNGASSSKANKVSQFAAAMQRVHSDFVAQLQPVSFPAAVAGKRSPSPGGRDRAAQIVQKRSPSPVRSLESQIVQVSKPKAQQRKRKQPTSTTDGEIKLEQPASQTSKSARGFVKPFDYTGVKSVLDAPMGEDPLKKKHKREKGDGARGQREEKSPPAFKKPPKSMNQPKSGNRSHTFL